MPGSRCPADRAAVLELAFLRHELSQPLTYLTGSIERLKRDATSPASRDRLLGALSTIEETVLHLNDIVRRIGTGSSADTLEPVDLAQLVRGTVAMVEGEVERVASLVTEVSCTATVLANRSRLRQALINLLTNAVFAVRESDDARGTITVRLLSEGTSHVALIVQDDGVGIPEQARTRVGRLHFTTRSDGSGLGLALCRSVVESHGGSLVLEPAPGRGVRAKMILPVSQT
jgi:signal transduction histidine kinase